MKERKIKNKLKTIGIGGAIILGGTITLGALSLQPVELSDIKLAPTYDGTTPVGEYIYSSILDGLLPYFHIGSKAPVTKKLTPRDINQGFSVLLEGKQLTKIDLTDKLVLYKTLRADAIEKGFVVNKIQKKPLIKRIFR